MNPDSEPTPSEIFVEKLEEEIFTEALPAFRLFAELANRLPSVADAVRELELEHLYELAREQMFYAPFDFDDGIEPSIDAVAERLHHHIATRRYEVSECDAFTFQVIDTQSGLEVCQVSAYSDGDRHLQPGDAHTRAEAIAHALNVNSFNWRPKFLRG